MPIRSCLNCLRLRTIAAFGLCHACYRYQRRNGQPRPSDPSFDWRKARVEASRKGGQALVKRYGPEMMQTLGKRGAAAVVKKFGIDHFISLGKISSRAGKRNKQPGADNPPLMP
jgi:hypothetical protein